ncbi:sensor histidine kinase [Paenibacillus abyssi]|uniref:Histidine kinase n=1 Tax=Paenibacillus abyssi TaxID=1340531 RepID=A0A917CQX9_9BACL|nr:sensor histidine kinase [Paenibacillus abyssi]GGF94886.1 histidine kinase [Paenibacillus abyssi]
MNRLHFNNVKLRDKLLLMYILCVLIPIVATNVIFYHVTTTNIRNQKIRDATFAIEKTNNEFQSIIDEAVGISYQFYFDPVFNELLNRDYPDAISYIEAYDSLLKGTFYLYTQTYLNVYTDNPGILTSGNIERITDDIKDSAWFQTLQTANASYPLLVFDEGGLSLLLRLDNNRSAQYLNLIKIDLNRTAIRQVIQNSAFDGNLYILSPEGMITFSNDPTIDWMSGRTTIQSIPVTAQTIQFPTPLSNANYLQGWSVYGTMDEKVAFEEVRKSRAFVVYLVCINFVLPTLIIAYISRSLHKRLVRLLKHMKKVKNQNFEPVPMGEDRDEIGQLTTEFNRMTNRIKSLIDDVYIADIEKKDLELQRRQAQLNALHSQINPHFLFNALETIRMRSVIKGEGETAKIIHNMAKIFRRSISWGRDWVSVGDELEFISCFLEIQKYRFGDKLDYKLRIDESVRELLIPKMTFLPYVENASIHGIESSPYKGFITIDIHRSSNELIFILKDNGIGMSAEKLKEIIHYLQSDEAIGENIGMKNAYSRLIMYYKDAFRFHIESEPGAGTRIEIRLPLYTAAEE